MSLIDDCERCSARVERQGDHLCAGCGEVLGRNVNDPYSGSFAAHADAAFGSELKRGRDLMGVFDDLMTGRRARG
jgi:hypothetical protein